MFPSVRYALGLALLAGVAAMCVSLVFERDLARLALLAAAPSVGIVLWVLMPRFSLRKELKTASSPVLFFTGKAPKGRVVWLQAGSVFCFESKGAVVAVEHSPVVSDVNVSFSEDSRTLAAGVVKTPLTLVHFTPERLRARRTHVAGWVAVSTLDDGRALISFESSTAPDALFFVLRDSVDEGLTYAGQFSQLEETALGET